MRAGPVEVHRRVHCLIPRRRLLFRSSLSARQQSRGIQNERQLSTDMSELFGQLVFEGPEAIRNLWEPPAQALEPGSGFRFSFQPEVATIGILKDKSIVSLW